MWWPRSAICSKRPKRLKRSNSESESLPGSGFWVRGSGQLPTAQSPEPRAVDGIERCARLLARLLRPSGRLMRIVGESMMPLLRPGALVLVDESAYHHRAPERGEIVAARPMSLSGRAVVKRVAGLPHERASLDYRSWALASGEYLLLGDAQHDSFDSRAFGPVTHQELIGRVWLCCWPLRKLSNQQKEG